MKRPLTIFALLLMSAAFLFTQESKAQLHVAAAYGDDTEFGVRAGYYMPLEVGDLEGLNVGVDGTFYLPSDIGGVDVTYFEINVNGHYDAIEVGEDGVGYAIGGLQYARLSAESQSGPFGTTFDLSSSDIGLNIGAGVGISKLFGEAKFGLGAFEQLVLTFGYNF